MILIWQFPSNERVPGTESFVRGVNTLDAFRTTLKEVVNDPIKMYADFVDSSTGEVLGYTEALRRLGATKQEIEQC